MAASRPLGAEAPWRAGSANWSLPGVGSESIWRLHLSHTASLPAEQIKSQNYHDHLPEASISFWNFLVRSRTSRSFDTALRPGDGVHGKIPAQVEIVS